MLSRITYNENNLAFAWIYTIFLIYIINRQHFLLHWVINIYILINNWVKSLSEEIIVTLKPEFLAFNEFQLNHQLHNYFCKDIIFIASFTSLSREVWN